MRLFTGPAYPRWIRKASSGTDGYPYVTRAGRVAGAAIAGMRACSRCRARVAGAGARPARRRRLGVGVSSPECPHLCAYDRRRDGHDREGFFPDVGKAC